MARKCALGIVLVTFVSLVTVSFSFLGTILCAALIGMMTGFGRRWQWETLAVSLVFPAVLLASLNVSSAKSELSLVDSLRLAAVCLGTFWATYLATRGLMLLEGGHHEHVASPSNAPHPIARSSQQPDSWRDVKMEELQGAWSQEVTLSSGERARKVVNVNEDNLTLSLVSQDGQQHLLAKARMELLKPRAAET